MANFGLAELYLVAPRCRIDREAEAMSVHGRDVLDAARIVATLDEALFDRTHVVGTSARVRAADGHRAMGPEAALAAVHTSDAAALVFGPEDTGLDNASLDRCDTVVTIPTAPYASLNLAQAVVLLAYLWFTARPVPGGDVAPRAAPITRPVERGQLEAMLAQFEALALRTGYTDARRATGMMRHMRRVLERAVTNADDVARLRGLWSQLAGALDRAQRGAAVGGEAPQPPGAGAGREHE